MPNFYLTPIGSEAGLTSVSLGVIRALERVGLRPGFFKPVAQPSHGEDSPEASSHFARELFHLAPASPLSMARVETLIGQGNSDQLMEELVALYQQSAQGVDAVVIEGLTPDSERGFVAGLNAAIPRNLNADLIFVVNAAQGDAKSVADQLDIALQEFGGQAKLAGYVLNKLPEGTDAAVFGRAVSQASRQPAAAKPLLLGAIPYEAELAAPRMLDVARFLKARVVNEGKLAETRVRDIVVAARSATHMLDRLKPGALIVGPGDRTDVMLVAALTALKGVPLAGLLLTCDSLPEPAVQSLVNPALASGIPILLTDADTYTTASLLANQSPHVPSDDLARMERVVDFVAEHLAVEPLKLRAGEPAEPRFPPPAFRFRLIEQARAANRRIVLPEGDEPRTIRAAVICQEKGIARCVLLGKPEKIREVAEAQGICLPTSLELLDPDSIRGHYIAPMVELRKSKGLNAPMAEAQLEDTVVLGTMMLATGEVDGLVSGAVHTTASTVRPALQLIKTAPTASLVSSVFFMLMPDQVFVYGDCAINPDPSAEQLADIAIQSADSAKAFGIEPRVAMISYSTGSSGSGSDVEKVREATQIARSKRPDLAIDGPMQYDAASVASVGRQKAPDSPVAGRANVFVFPDLNTGNTTYKAVQRSANVVSVGPMLQGLRKPVNDLSRGALVDDIVYTIALTAIQAVQMETPAA